MEKTKQMAEELTFYGQKTSTKRNSKREDISSYEVHRKKQVKTEDVGSEISGNETTGSPN